MNIFDKYFRYSGKALNLEHEKSQLYKEIRRINKEQRKIYEKQRVYEKDIRQMHDNKEFESYGDEMSKWAYKLRLTKKP